MEAFIAIITSFPTAIFATTTIVATCYWMMSILGFFDLDIVELDIEAESGDVSFVSSAIGFFGLTGVPFALIFTFLSAFSFLFCYYGVYFGLLFTSATWMTIVSGSILLILSFFLSLPVSGFAIKPFRKLYGKLNEQTAEKVLLGVECSVRSSRVDSGFGEAQCIIDGASLIIKVRSDDESFKRGDKVVIIEHDSERNIYHVVSTHKFNQ